MGTCSVCGGPTYCDPFDGYCYQWCGDCVGLESGACFEVCTAAGHDPEECSATGERCP
jgi:hypothetical protein